MTSVIFFVLALSLGYLVAVGIAMLATFAISSASPGFVIKDCRVRRRFKFAQDSVWLLCAIAGGYVTTMAGPMEPVIAAIALGSLLIFALWKNVREMRQRGVPHQIAMSALSLVGVVVGYALRVR